jgi:hypothetical protein
MIDIAGASLEIYRGNRFPCVNVIPEGSYDTSESRDIFQV